MKKNNTKLIMLALCLFLLTGCAKTLTDENKRIVKYNASIICDSCTSSCDKDDSDCAKTCEIKCNESKKNQTGQNLTKNILCQPTNKDVVEIYEKYGVNIKSLPTCPNLSLTSGYEGLWVSLFVKPLAWLIIKVGILLKNYGFSLVLISILIRVALMPLTKKTAVQSENLKKAQPELDRLNKKYENKTDKDSQLQKSQETIVIYQKYGINPMSSCLFALIQIPLLFAFIEAINRTPAIFEGKFLGLHLGITPLTALKNGQWYYLLVIIILAVVTYFSLNLNKGASAPGDDTQKQMNTMNKFMLVFITYASLNLSTAICLYWISSSAFTIFQNLLVKRVK